ncbi:AAA domain-containing protein [Cladophialophora immunda]|nr:AAA domain-containing protein [Cladophialophora immunda]
MQETVLILAKDGGLQRIKQVVERNMEGMSLETRWKTIKEQAIPLCQVITHPHVLASTLLDIHLGTIYNFIYGVQGQRAVHFFKLLVATLADRKQVDILPSEIEAVVRAFSKIIDCNTHALVNDDLRPLADTLFDTVAQIDEGEAHESRRLVNRINQRLGIGRELTGWKPPKTTAPPRAIFTLQQDLPGNLSKDGPRHDNDCVNAYDIQIMPTFEEINATRPEYLPSMGQQDWHLPGVSGLLDRHFRLLREDTVGQLRDAVRQEVQASYSPKNGGKRQGPRKLTYDNAQVVKLDFSRWQGLLITIGFDQPSHLRQRSVKQRKEWWEFQKRLRMGSLLCLLSNGALIFCSVIERRPTKPSAITDDSSSSGNEQVSNKSEQPLDLFSDPLRAFTTVSLVGDAIEDVLGLMKASTSAPARIVEFPGVLLPSFEPTLRALQGMLRNTEIPFSDYLAPEPQADLSMIAPPYYATKPNFEFDLSCVMKDKSPMRIAVNDESNHEAFRENSVLDRAQADALLTSLQRSLALIQGPPGTGKSFTGVALIKVLLAIQARAKLGPILCVCYTNHALDQLLEDLVRHGIDQIVRVGSQSKSEMLQDCNLRILASKIDLTKTEKHEHWVLKSKLDEDERAISKAIKRLSFKGDVAAIRSYLEIYHPMSYLTLFAGGQDDDGFQSVVYNKTSLLNTWRKGGSHQGPVRPLRTLLEESRIHFLNHPERQRLYHHWLAESKKAAQAALLTALAEYKEHKEQFDQVRAGVDLRCLQQAKIIGVTTTGLARITPLLRKLNSKVLICEEAGEVLEAHILTALLPSLEHAILIGDHLQLPPHIQSYELSRESSSGKRHSLDISLFERLVTPSCSTQTAVPYSTLETQRRMHPSISELIRNTLYPRLCDSSVVETYPPVTGLAKRLFWFDHAHTEDGAATETDSTTSHSNTFEVQMVTSLVSHLVRQGVYQANDLAVLTPYLGQLQKIRRALQGLFEISLTEGDILELEKDEVGKENAEPGHSVAPTLQKTPLSRALKVSTIDNFQGEEAKVVIISLVRSNDQNKCGFLRTSNRINVLLSRAKHGMYIIGNSRTSGHVQMWASVIDMLQSGDNFGESLQLQCPRHPQATFSVSKPDDFAIFSPEGGCNLPCEMRLSCGHSCISKCHSQMLHSAVKCLEPCPRPLKGYKLTLSGGRKEQIKLIFKLAYDKRYSSIAKTRNRIMKYLQQVGVEEQPFKRVWDMVQFARKQGKTNSDVEFDHTVVQTSQTLQGESLLLRCELVMLSDFLATFGSSLQDVNLESNRVDCLKVLTAAREARQPAVEVEAHTFYAQCCLAERTYSSRSDILMALSKEATEHIDAAKQVCDLHPEPTRHVVGEVKTVEGMLESSTFTTVVNDAEWRLVINAMASGFRGSGHWYTCANNHPFTVGECGMPMERARCPQCGAPVGGQDHTPAEGVRRATDLENRFSDLRL